MLKYKYDEDTIIDECWVCGFEPEGICMEYTSTPNDRCGKPATRHLVYDWAPDFPEVNDTLCYDVCEECYQKALNDWNAYAIQRGFEIINIRGKHDRNDNHKV